MPRANDVSERTRLTVDLPTKESYGAPASGNIDIDSPVVENCSSPKLLHLAPEKVKAITALRTAAFFCFVFMCVEVIGGYVANSLAILTDAAHLLTDLGAFCLSLYALHASARGSDHQYSYGHHRAEVVGTLASVFTIWALVGAIVLEALDRLKTMYTCAYISKHHRAEGFVCVSVDGGMMMIVGALGLVVNLGCAAILSWGGGHGHSHGALGGGHCHAHGEAAGEGPSDEAHSHSHGGAHSHGDTIESHEPKTTKSMALNAAFLHAIGDSIQSVGVVLAGLFIYLCNRHFRGQVDDPESAFNMADPACSLLFAVVTLFTTKGLIRQLLSILMESTPDGVDYAGIRRELRRIPDVENVHDLHIWSLTADQAALSVHLVSDQQKAALQAAQAICSAHGIDHTTIQVDPPEIGAEKCITKMGCHNC